MNEQITTYKDDRGRYTCQAAQRRDRVLKGLIQNSKAGSKLMAEGLVEVGVLHTGSFSKIYKVLKEIYDE